MGVDREAPVGFREIRLRFELEALLATTERYCVVLQTITGGVPVGIERATNS